MSKIIKSSQVKRTRHNVHGWCVIRKTNNNNQQTFTRHQIRCDTEFIKNYFQCIEGYAGYAVTIFFVSAFDDQKSCDVPYMDYGWPQN